MGLLDFFKKKPTEEQKERLDQGLEHTRSSLFGKLSKAVAGKSRVDDDFLDELEEVLISSDVGVATTIKIIERIETRVSKDKYLGEGELNKMLKEEIVNLVAMNELPVKNTTVKPYVIMVVGVNGVGKTTTIGKLSNMFKAQGLKVVLGAADTFRAAAVDQIKIWGERVGVEVVAKGMNTDPAAVAFEAVKYGKDMNADVVIIDTAGRLHTKVNLMNELSKIKRVMDKQVEGAPHEVLLVLDASTGQNAFEQAKQFTTATDVTALALTKLDGTAKGGVVLGISDQFSIPVKYIGVGEQINDLQIFNAKSFVDSLFAG
ncbi:MAG: signal recognition particle-docking protein FtsY [Bacteroidia bacterium]|jgi:fused signal recognition particle receptor|nr:signal recognition particle-docking protein FtsY [Bacteroidia bacterium]